jgi:hypothetical protein
MVLGPSGLEPGGGLVQYSPCFAAVPSRAIEPRDMTRSRMRGLVTHVRKVVVDATPVAMHHNHAATPR